MAQAAAVACPLVLWLTELSPRVLDSATAGLSSTCASPLLPAVPRVLDAPGAWSKLLPSVASAGAGSIGGGEERGEERREERREPPPRAGSAEQPTGRWVTRGRCDTWQYTVGVLGDIVRPWHGPLRL